MTAHGGPEAQEGVLTTSRAAVLGVCGWSGSGKTTLLEAVLPSLREDGLSVAVIKHDAHGLCIDQPGKDSDRLFRAGGDLIVQGPDETLARLHRPSVPLLMGILDVVTGGHDLVLVEGHKDTPLPKVWISGPDADAPPDSVRDVLSVLPRSEDRPQHLLAVVRSLLNEALHQRPLRAAVLVGKGAPRSRGPRTSMRPDRLKDTVETLRGLTQGVVLVGPGSAPPDLREELRIPDAPGVDGSIAGLLAALRWDPAACWLVASRWNDGLDDARARALLALRRVGCWAVLSEAPSGLGSPYPAVYEPQARPLLEDIARSGLPAPRRLADHARVAVAPHDPA